MPGQYFIHDPEHGTYFYDTPAALNKAMDDYDFLGKFCDDGWSEMVENVCAGFIPAGVVCNDDEDDESGWEDKDDFYDRHATHTAQKYEIQKRPDDVGDDGYSPSDPGTYWGEYIEICGYSFQKKGGL